jgi:hypothetical protein
MRTLATQMRLRRLLRTQADYHERLLSEARPGPLATAGSTRLLHLLDDVGTTWAQEGKSLAVPGLRGYVSRSMASMRAALAAMATPRADLTRLNAEFGDAALPLLFFLRGLDDSGGSVLAELGGHPLARSA